MGISQLTPESVGGGIAGLAGMWLMFGKLLLKKAIDDTSKSSAEAETAVIELLRGEVERMALSNKELGRALKEFQLENVELRREISDLHETINTLSERLNSIDRARDKCKGCEFDIYTTPMRRVTDVKTG